MQNTFSEDTEAVLPLVITEAGLAALSNATHTGTTAVTITEIALGDGLWEPDPSATALKNELKRVTSFGGQQIADAVIHVTIQDPGEDPQPPTEYTLSEFGLYLEDGTLFAIYGQTTPIMDKTESSILLLAADMQFTNPTDVEIVIAGGGIALNPATEELPGVSEIATQEEVDEGTDHQRFVTSKTLKAVSDRALYGFRGAEVSRFLLSNI